MTLPGLAVRLLCLIFASSTALAGTQKPILFVHGNGDSAALWHTTIWRFESNGYNRERLVAIDIPHPAAPQNDSRPEENRSTTTDQKTALSEAVSRTLLETGEEKLILVGSSRGGNTIRNYIKNAGGHANVDLAILCGTPNHGVSASEEGLDSEWNGRGHFLSRLNQGSEGHPAVRFVTIRSDKNDKYAQPMGDILGFAGRPTGVGYESPELRGARNIVLDGLDHREVAFHRRAFREMFRVITGDAPESLEIVSEEQPILDGMVSGFTNGAATNLPLSETQVEVYEVDPDTGQRLGGARRRLTTSADSRWGPFEANPEAYYEFVLRAEGYPITHVYRTPFPRSSRYVHFRLSPIDEIVAGHPGAGSLVTMTRPRGYLGHGRDLFTIDGKVPVGVREGVPATSSATQPFPSGRSVRVVLNQESLAVRTYPLEEGHWSVAEFHH